jgi:hypothetical protein
MKVLKIEEVNVKNSNTWTACNDDSRSNYWRSLFLEQNGGEFVKEGRYWKWQKIEDPVGHFYLFTDINNNVVKIDNMLEYCRKNNLSRAALYEVMSGKRKQYKGYRYQGEEINGNIILERRNRQ